jgi:hypothetical protein
MTAVEARRWKVAAEALNPIHSQGQASQRSNRTPDVHDLEGGQKDRWHEIRTGINVA